jgi:hypothetical protein
MIRQLKYYAPELLVIAFCGCVIALAFAAALGD